MKKLRIFQIAIAVIGAIPLTSCGDSEDENPSVVGLP